MDMICSRTCAGSAVALLLSLAAPAGRAAPSGLSYNHDIRPVLSDNCFSCHGPDQSKRKGKLRLDLRDEAVGQKGHCSWQGRRERDGAANF